MAAPRKDEERLRLYAAALKLFGEKGYAATSYQDIADACDTSKSVVQHYYPHKEMFLSLYLDEHFAWVRETAQKLCPSHTSAIQLLCMMGFIHLDRLVAEEKGSPLIQDLLGFRTFIEGVVMRERDWIVAHWPDAIDQAISGRLPRRRPQRCLRPAFHRIARRSHPDAGIRHAPVLRSLRHIAGSEP